MKINKWLVLILVVTVLTSISTAYAYMYKKTQVVTNEFELAQVSCEIHEEFVNVSEEVSAGVTEVTSSLKKSIKIENTSTIDAYIRVIVNVYWQDTKGNQKSPKL